MAACVGTNGKVHAFEPIPSLAERLRKLAGERLRQLAVHQVALSDHSGQSKFQFVRDVTGWSGLQRRDFSHPVHDEMIVVPVSTLDYELSDLSLPWTIYKLDIEGGELHAIQGSRALIAKHRPFIVFENGFDKTASLYGYTKEEWFQTFSDLEYTPYDLYGVMVTPNRWPDYCQPYYTIAVASGSSHEDFLRSDWAAILARTVSRARSRV